MNFKQRLILRKLVTKRGQKYSELYRNFSPDDKFPYHLKKLLSEELISKRDNKYFITKEGMKLTSDFDTRTLEIIQTPTLLFLFICKYGDKFLINEHFSDDETNDRKIYTLPFSKPRRGASLEKCANSEFLRKYGIEANLKYKATYHQTDHTSDGDILFDDLWLVFEGEVSNSSDSGRILSNYSHWLTREEIALIPNVHPMVKRLTVDRNKKTFLEDSIVLNYGLDKNMT